MLRHSLGRSFYPVLHQMTYGRRDRGGSSTSLRGRRWLFTVLEICLVCTCQLLTDYSVPRQLLVIYSMQRYLASRNYGSLLRVTTPGYRYFR